MTRVRILCDGCGDWCELPPGDVCLEPVELTSKVAAVAVAACSLCRHVNRIRISELTAIGLVMAGVQVGVPITDAEVDLFAERLKVTDLLTSRVT